MGAVALMIVAVVVIVASNLNYCAAEHPWLERAYSVGVPPAVAISDVMGLTGLVLMVVAVGAGMLTGLDGFFTAASSVFLNGKECAPRNAILLVRAVCLVTPWFGTLS